MAFLQGVQGANGIQEKTYGGNSFAPLPAGGYVCQILDVKVDKTQKGNTYIKLRFDVSEGEHAGYFRQRFNADVSSQYSQKWKGIYKIFLPTFNGDNDKYTNAIALYKGQINTIARSNNMQEPNIEAGYDPDIFKGCTVGILFRDAEYNGNKYTEPAFLCETQKIRSGDYEVPAPRIQSAASGAGAFNMPSPNGGVYAAASFSQPQQQAFSQPTSANAQQPVLGDLSDFEEIISNDKVPF